MLTVLIDYESGNLHSAEKAFQRMAEETGAGEVLVSGEPEAVARADRVVLPGDGAFPACRRALFDHSGLFEALDEAVMRRGVPFFGICIGVVHIDPADKSLKVPHMGWNDLVIDHPHPVLAGIATGDHAYFVHSYHFRVAEDAHRLAHAEYAGDITAIVGRDTIFGTQFHPEKSQAAGLKMIANFLRWKP